MLLLWCKIDRNTRTTTSTTKWTWFSCSARNMSSNKLKNNFQRRKKRIIATQFVLLGLANLIYIFSVSQHDVQFSNKREIYKYVIVIAELTQRATHSLFCELRNKKLKTSRVTCMETTCECIFCNFHGVRRYSRFCVKHVTQSFSILYRAQGVKASVSDQYN